MYCSKCGSAVSPNLTYCNHCGAKLSGAKEMKPETLVAAIAAVFIFGLAAIIFLMIATKFVFGHENPALTMAFPLLGFLVMLVVEGVFIRLLLGRNRGIKGADVKGSTTNELDAAQARMLPEPVLSVTEHTTRTLETVDRDYQTG